MMALFLVAALVVVISAAELLSWYFGLGFGSAAPGWWAIGGWADPLPPVGYRLALAFNVATWLSNFTVVSLPIVLAWALTARRREDRQALGLVVLGLVWVLLFSLSRGAFLGLVAGVGVGLAGYLLPQLRLKRLPRRALGALAAFLIFAGAVVLYVISISGAAGRASGDQGRLDLWQGALEMAQQEPFTGAGVYQFGYFMRDLQPITPTTAHLKTAHNLYLNTLAELGVPGLLVLGGLGIAFGWTLWHRWRLDYRGHRVRLIGIMASLTTFAVQSVVDTFTYTSTVLPVLIAAAYGVAGHIHASNKPPRLAPSGIAALLRPALAVAVLAYGFWLLRVDLAQVQSLQAYVASLDGDHAKALSQLERAQALDPDLRLYDLQRAYLLGVAAEEDPATYLGKAIAAYQRALEDDPNYDIGQANLAALLAQAGDFEGAAAAMQRATSLRPDLAVYWLKLGDYQAAADQEATALESYAQGISLVNLVPMTVRTPFPVPFGSGYWEDEAAPWRQTALENAYAGFGPFGRLFLIAYRDWGAQDADLLTELPAPADFFQASALGFYQAYQGNPAAAAAAYEQALAFDDGQPWVYAQLARARLALGENDAAEQAAQHALFLDAYTGAEAHAVLAALAHQRTPEEETRINAHLIRAVPPRIVIQSYFDVVFGQPGVEAYLPQLALPGWGEAFYAPWFELAERYAADDDPDTDPVDVYRAIWQHDPYIERARLACGAACA
ncbi:MAG: O-antigen ligase family protein [Anaerolineae bacterium]|nr:O-antigen ligase family protein [Anaerolineae bacterium]